MGCRAAARICNLSVLLLRSLLVNQKDMEAKEATPDGKADLTQSRPEGMEESRSPEIVSVEPKKRAGWIEPVILLGMAMGIWLARIPVVALTYKVVPLWCWSLVDFTCYALSI